MRLTDTNCPLRTSLPTPSAGTQGDSSVPEAQPPGGRKGMSWKRMRSALFQEWEPTVTRALKDSAALLVWGLGQTGKESRRAEVMCEPGGEG